MSFIVRGSCEMVTITETLYFRLEMTDKLDQEYVVCVNVFTNLIMHEIYVWRAEDKDSDVEPTSSKI